MAPVSSVLQVKIKLMSRVTEKNTSDDATPAGYGILCLPSSSPEVRRRTLDDVALIEDHQVVNWFCSKDKASVHNFKWEQWSKEKTLYTTRCGTVVAQASFKILSGTQDHNLKLSIYEDVIGATTKFIKANLPKVEKLKLGSRLAAARFKFIPGQNASPKNAQVNWRPG